MMDQTKADRIDLLALHIERGCSRSDQALVELAEMARGAHKVAGQHESVASVAMAEVERLRTTAITFTCHECGEFFDEPIQSFLSESGDPVLAPTLCVDCGHDEDGE